MSFLPIEDEKIGVIMQGHDPKHNFAFAATIGLNLGSAKTEFISATGAASQKELGIRYKPGVDPAEFRKKIIECKVSMINRGKNIHIKEANSLFEGLFGKYSKRLCQLLAENQANAAKKHLRDIMANKLMDSKIIEIDIYFVEFKKLMMKTETIPQPQKNTAATEASFQSNNFPSVNTIPVSPVIGLKNGLKVSAAQPGDRILVRPSGRAAAKFTEANNNSDKIPSLPATFSKFQSTGNGEGIMQVQLREDIMGQCTVSPGSLLKKARSSPMRAEDSVQKNITLLVWLIVSCIIIFGFSWFLISSLGS
ncbi:MAG: hypothetical protein ACLFN5_03575 [bacterium]